MRTPVRTCSGSGSPAAAASFPFSRSSTSSRGRAGTSGCGCGRRGRGGNGLTGGLRSRLRLSGYFEFAPTGGLRNLRLVLPQTAEKEQSMAKAIVTPGEKFGRWTVVEEAPRRGKHRYARVRCACGTAREVNLGSLRRGISRSCGCLAAEVSAETGRRQRRHGYSSDYSRGRRSPTYASWTAMRRRCLSPNSANYYLYGGRGIRVCKRWDQFEAFLADMGDRPRGTSLDRIDVDGDYEPGNCRWATRREQGNNRRPCKYLTYNGRTQTVTRWAEELGVPRGAIYQRLKRGWSADQCLLRPVIAADFWDL